jgi:hypothetical protein
MKVINIHERKFKATCEQVGGLIDSLSSSSDGLWPKKTWPPMIFDCPLSVGATGGHGPIRYAVESYTPGQSVKFRFLGPKGFDGFHSFEIVRSDGQSCVLRHTIDMTVYGKDSLSWLLFFRPMHNALLEDSLTAGQASLGLEPEIRKWSPWVRLLRWLIAKIKK